LGWIGVERGRAFDGVEHPKPSGRAGTDIDQPSAATEPVGDGFNRLRNRGGFGGNAFGTSADGNVIVGLSAATGGVFAFRWSNPAAGGAGLQSIGLSVNSPEAAVVQNPSKVHLGTTETMTSKERTVDQPTIFTVIPEHAGQLLQGIARGLALLLSISQGAVGLVDHGLHIFAVLDAGLLQLLLLGLRGLVQAGPFSFGQKIRA